MSAPNLTIQVEPAEAASCVYGALAARTSNDLPNGQLSLVLTITNNGASSVHLNQVTVSFIGPPSVSPSAIVADLTIAATQTKQWNFGTANNIILPVPAPGTITLGLSCDGFSDPATVNMPLAQYVCPATGGAYAFPAKSADLKQGEYWTGVSAAHGPAGGGSVGNISTLRRLPGWPAAPDVICHSQTLAPPRAVASAPVAFRVRVWEVMSRGRGPRGECPPPEGINVAYPPVHNQFSFGAVTNEGDSVKQNRELPSGLEARILTEDVWLLNQRFMAIRPAPHPP